MKNNLFGKISIQTKLAVVFVFTSLIILVVNLFMYVNINNMVNRMDRVYQGNLRLNELNRALRDVQDNMTEYLNVKNSDTLEAYYRSVQEYTAYVDRLSDVVSSDAFGRMERNIKKLSENYLELTNQTVEAKRGRNVEKYNSRYESATKMYEHISTYIYSLNNEQFNANSANYEALSISLRSLELVSNLILVAVIISNILLILILTKTITSPLKTLADTADEVAEGNFEVALLPVQSQDEIGIVTRAFNTMVVNIREYIERIKKSMELEREMKERELLMETHLKDAQLKYLQAQINPHFLFNTLNAGAQLAMMEGADRTYEYIQNMADFFRYNVKKNNETVTLAEEIELVDNYIYILNVRFSGEIHFEKKVDKRYTYLPVPSMLLQPIVENSVNYGIRNIDWEGKITLSVYAIEDTLCISIKDNGIGMSQEKIDKIMTSRLKEADLSQDSNGIGLDNVIGRLRLFLKTEDNLEILSGGKNQGTEVRIYLPIPDENI
ncbi:MAG: histidine kinase [Clostridiales bacterium]|nr:histidine kinase [Clostridiales bacterium]